MTIKISTDMMQAESMGSLPYRADVVKKTENRVQEMKAEEPDQQVNLFDSLGVGNRVDLIA